LPQLIALQKALQENPKLKIRVEGHVCCIDTVLAADALDEGTGEYALSLNRARAIAQELIKRGIKKERIQAVGFGKRKALFPREQNQEEAERNRRVEVRVLDR
jgi:outer membrane protein OmpA-like peptidoglycan-associated protein